MKFSFDRDAMIKEIAIAQEIIASKSPITILSNILLIAENNSLTIKATDSTVKFTTTIPVDIQEEGSTTIYCDKFMSIISSLPSGDIEFIKEDIAVTIKPIAKRVKFQLKSQASDKFPELGSSDNVPFFELPAKEFKEMIKHTIFAVFKDVKDIKSRSFMTGVYFEKEGDNLTMVSTNGNRLSCITKTATNVPDFPPANIPTKILSCVLKNLSDEGNVSIAVVDNSIFIKFANFEFSSTLIDGRFPNYKKVIPENLTTSLQVNKTDLEAALKRITIMADKEVFRILFKVTPGVLKLISPETDSGAAEEEIPCRYDGQNITIAMNFVYVTEPLKVIDTENVVIEFNVDENREDEGIVTKAVIIRSEPATDYQHVVMPLKG